MSWYHWRLWRFAWSPNTTGVQRDRFGWWVPMAAGLWWRVGPRRARHLTAKYNPEASP